MIVYSVVCVRMLVTVMAEPENEEVEFSWKRFVCAMALLTRALHTKPWISCSAKHSVTLCVLLKCINMSY